MIAILHYGIGNLLSVQNMLRKAGVTDALITSEAGELRRADKIVLPGVGHFDNGMKLLRASGMFDALHQKVVVERTPVLGICLGAEMLTKGSEEGDEPGLGWIDAHCDRFRPDELTEPLAVPHMGWAEVSACKESKLLADLPENPRYYFSHSYHIVCENLEDRLLAAHHGIEFTAAVERGNIAGVQFHPEKSHKFGLRLLANFAGA